MSRPKKRRKYRSSSFQFETFLINYGLQLAGGLLIAGSLVYLFASNLNARILAEILGSFTKSSVDESGVKINTVSSLSGYLSLLLFIPGILLLVFQHLLRSNYAGLKKILVSLGFIWLIFSLGKVLFEIRAHHIELSYYLILTFFCIIQLFAITFSIAGKSRFLLNWAVIWFFVSFILIRIIYGVIIPNIIFLIGLQIVVSIFCFRYNWRSPFILIMTLSSFYITYYFIKLVIVAGSSSTAVHFMLPGLFTWFILSATGFGIFKPGSGRKIISFIWYSLPYFTLVVVTGLYLGFYYKAGISYVSLLYYALTVTVLIIIGFFNRKYAFMKHEDPFYISLCIFAAFLLPQLFESNFFLVLAASLAVTLLINVLLTNLKVSFHLSMGMFFATLGLYLVYWAFTIIPALLAQRISGTQYSIQIVLGSLLLFALSYYYNNLFKQLINDYSFSHSQSRSYKNSVRTLHYSILYLTGFLIFDYSLILIVPDYRVNMIEWGFYTYTFLYIFTASLNPKSRTKLRYIIPMSLLAVVLYPAVIHPETIHFRTLYLAGNSSALMPFILHYFSLGVLLLFIFQVNGKLSLLYPKNLFITNTRMLIGIMLLCFILLSEYDHLLLLSMNRLSNQSAYEILQYNKYIPYSVILLSVSVILFVFSLIHYTRFLRRLSMLMILAVLIKVLFIDITILSAEKSILLLISMGVILLVFSFLIPRLRNQSKIRTTSEVGSAKELTDTKFK